MDTSLPVLEYSAVTPGPSELFAAAQANLAQAASLRFFAPVTLAYLAACAGWWVLARMRFAPAPTSSKGGSAKPWVDFPLALLAVGGVFLIGMAWRRGWLLPNLGGWRGAFLWQLNNLLIYSPIFLVLLVRRQGLDTVYLSASSLGPKLLTGLGLAVVATTTHLALRRELPDWLDVWSGTIAPRNLSHFLPVFLEGVALAFLFERLRWCVGLLPSLLIPAVLFAAGHVPRQISDGLGAEEIAAFFILNTVLPAVILFVVSLSRDVIWIGIVHYVMDIAIRAFD